MADAWFSDQITQGLARLFVLRLESTPAADILDGVQQVWVEAIWSRPVGWDEQLDAQRLVAGFRTLTGRCRRWPAPLELLEAMPSRPPQPQLPAPVMTDEQICKNKARLAGLIQQLRER